MARREQCLLCGAQLTRLADSTGIQQHPESKACLVEYTDAWGVPLDALPELEADPLAVDPVDGEIKLQIFPPVEEVIAQIFDELGLARPGGASSGKGWTSYSIFQRCPYAWKRRYIDPPRANFLGLSGEDPNRAIGTLVHLFLAMYYAPVDGPYHGINIEHLYQLIKLQANPKLADEGWRLFDSYRRYHQPEIVGETIIPLAIEHDLRDPRTGESCRYDLIAFFPRDTMSYQAGTYIVEHKTAQRFDKPTLDGWSNDGEVIGEALLYTRLGLAKRFGPLRGVMVNIIGKQQEPKFHRTVVAPSSLLLDDHAQSLRHWDGLMALARSTGIYPRARGNCINRWGMCEHWEHCATEES